MEDMLPLRYLCGALTLAGCGDSSGDGAASPDAFTGSTITRTYQQGTDGYDGTRSVGISTYGGLGAPGTYNENGMTFADGQNDWCTGTDIPSGAYSEVWLLRFDLDLPPTAQIVSATLSVHGYGDGSHGLYFAGAYLAKPWFEHTPISCAGCTSAVGWRFANGSGAAWDGMGASAATDTVAGAQFRLPPTGEVADTSGTPNELTAELDPAMVQAWVSGTNHGMRIVAGTPMVHMGYVQPQRDAGGRPTTMRPKLTVVYANP